MGKIESVIAEDIIAASDANIYMIILVSPEVGHATWLGNAFENMDATPTGFLNMKGFKKEVAAQAYYNALGFARQSFQEGNLQLIGLPKIS